MKTLLLLIAITIVPTISLTAQILSDHYFGGSEAESNPLLTKSGNFYFAGCATYSYNGDFLENGGLEDMGLIILDSNLNKISSHCYGGPKDQHPFAMVANGSGGVVMIGYTTLLNGNCNVYIVDVDLNGDTIWTRNYGGSETDVGYGISKVSDGYLILAQTSIGGNSDAWIFKIDDNGDMIIGSSMTIGGSGVEFFRKVLPVDDGYALFGSTNSVDGDLLYCTHWGEFDGLIVKINQTVDSILYIEKFGGPGQDYLVNAIQKGNTHYIVGSTSSSTINGDSSGLHGIFDVWFMAIDSAVNVIMSHCYGGSGQDNGYTIMSVDSGRFILGGTAQSNDGDVSGNHGSFDTWIVKIDLVGELLDADCYGGSGYDEGTNVALIAEGSKIIVAAHTSSNNDGDVIGDHSSEDIRVFTVEDSSIATNVATVVNAEMRMLLYPNPTSDFVSITNHNNEELFLVTMEGKILWSGKSPIDMRDFPDGMYLVWTSKKFIGKVIKK